MGITKSKGHKEINDKFYTHQSVAKMCIDMIDLSSYDVIVEPSAGNGSFSNQIPNCIAYDLVPEHPNIIQQDYLKLDTWRFIGKKVLTIGNPPFGHFGEQIIGTYFSDGNGKNYLSDLTEEQQFDFTQFDGNAQGFRILTRMPYLNDLNGLNLTYAVLAASLKYPNCGSKNKKGGASVHKHGVFSSEADVLGRVADACRLRRADGTIKRHPLAFLVEAADTICYRSMDLEDGIQSGMLSLDEALCFLGMTPSHDTPERALVNLRVAIIGELTRYALQRFMANLEGIDMGTFDEELLDGNELCAQLGKLEFERIFRHNMIAQAELKGAQVMNAILDRVLPMLMEPQPDWRLNAIISPSMTRLVLAEEYQKHLSATPDLAPLTELSDLSTYNRLRLLIDWLSGMTDRYALETYHRLLAL